MSEKGFIAQRLERLGYSSDEAESLVQLALDEHAHELAEKIRRWEREALSLLPLERAAAKGAASLIDPASGEG